MKKTIIVLAIILTGLFNVQAQKMDVGTNFLSLGVGPAYSYTGYAAIALPAVRINFDHGLKEIGPGVLTLGGSLGFFTEHYKSIQGWWDLNGYHTSDYRANWTFCVAAFRVGYYYNFKDLGIPDLNAYAGIGSGLRYMIYSDNFSGPDDKKPIRDESGAQFHMAAYGGANYFVTKKIALFTEFGYDISYFTAGATFQL